MNERRVPKYDSADRDIVEQLNYVASQLPGACKNPNWGYVHGGPLQEAAREIRRLRSIVYTSRGEALGARPRMQFVGPQVASPEREVWLAGLTEAERTADREYGFPVVRYELDAVRLRRGELVATEPDLCSTCACKARRNADIFARYFSLNPPTQKAMAAEYGITSSGVHTVIQKRLHALRAEGPKDSSEWEAWSQLKARELALQDVKRFTEALWGREA